MKYVIDNQVVLSRAPEGPLAPYLSPFARSAREQGYAKKTIHRKVHLVACFSSWLKKRRVKLRNITAGHIASYLNCRAKHVRTYPDDTAGIRQFIGFLRHADVIPVEKSTIPRLTPVEQCVQAYIQYLRETRALANPTVISYAPFVRNFLERRFGNRQVTLSRLSADDVVNFVQREAPHLHLKRAKIMTTALRSFLQYGRFRGEVTLDLAAAVPVVANWSMPSIPRAIAPDQVRKMLASVNRHTAIGRRDYAILLLLARLGLRAGEVAFLELDDIDWSAGQLCVRGKSGQRNELPLSAEVGKAIAAYLRRGRPDCDSRRVFLRATAPIRGLGGSSSICYIVRRWLEHAGVDAPTYGAHQFRHGLATEMLRQGASLSDIGEVLGHRHPDTTRIYTKVDIKSLRTLALPWPGGAR